MATTTPGQELGTAFAKNVRSRRKALGMTQVQMQELAGIRQSYLSKVERGEVAPGFDVLARLADALQCDAADLFRVVD